MPAGSCPSYRSLSTNSVYQSTTVPNQSGGSSGSNGGTILDYIKKTFTTNADSSPGKCEPLIAATSSKPFVITRNNILAPTKMEEIQLLRPDMPAMDEIELNSVQYQAPRVRSLSRSDILPDGVEEVMVETDRGPLLVAIQGDKRRPAILTYHDIGLNYLSNFQAFFNYPDMRNLLDNFSVYHVNAPGQEEGAPTLPENYVYPSMDELANQLMYVLAYFGLEHVIGVGVGAGGNILARFAYNHPDKVESMCLINVVSTPAGWIEWGYQKVNARYLRTKGMTQGVLDYLMWHHFGRNTEDRNYDLVQVYRNYFEKCVNPVNLALFIDSYIRRSDLRISRDADYMQRRDSFGNQRRDSVSSSSKVSSGRQDSIGSKGRKDSTGSSGSGGGTSRRDSTTLDMPIINITGAQSPHVEDTVLLNSRLNPNKSSWIKLSDCGMVLEEQPEKVCVALKLFLQGNGYAVRVARPQYTPSASLEDKNV